MRVSLCGRWEEGRLLGWRWAVRVQGGALGDLHFVWRVMGTTLVALSRVGDIRYKYNTIVQGDFSCNMENGLEHETGGLRLGRGYGSNPDEGAGGLSRGNGHRGGSEFC